MVAVTSCGNRDASVSKNGDSDNIVCQEFVDQTLNKILTYQTVAFGNVSGNTRAVVVSAQPERSYLSLGTKNNVSFDTYYFPGQQLEANAFRFDMGFICLTNELSLLSKDRTAWRDMAEASIVAFGKYGFDDKSGLGYLGTSADLYVLTLSPTGVANPVPYFKPQNTGTCPELPLEMLWKILPDKTDRMFRSMYYGLITDEASFDFNRYVSYGYDDSAKQLVVARRLNHLAFDSVGARMVHWWASGYAQTGDLVYLDWAQRMANKWKNVQNGQTGLIPNFFGGVAHVPDVNMPPSTWSESRGAALTVSAWIDASNELKKREGGRGLAIQLDEMAMNLANGILNYTFDTTRKIFIENVALNGSRLSEAARYTFPTQEEKDKYVAIDPKFIDVPVYDGAGLYNNPEYWTVCAGTDIPYYLARAAVHTNDTGLLLKLKKLSQNIMEENRQLTSSFTKEGFWTFRASGQYIKMFMLLYNSTKDHDYLEWGNEIANREIAHLKADESDGWWKLPERNIMLEALMMLMVNNRGGNA